MLELARYHAAARCRRVIIRSSGSAPGSDGAGPGAARSYVRKPDETAVAFLARLRAPEAADEQLGPAEPVALEAQLGTAPVFAALLRGDLALPEGSSSYALFRQQLTPTLSAADLLA